MDSGSPPDPRSEPMAGPFRRILLWTWLVVIVAALLVLGFAISGQIARSQFAYAVRTVADPGGNCWRIGVDVDFTAIQFEGGQPFYDQCGGDPRTVELGKCHTRVLVSAEVRFQGLPNTELSVDIFRAGQVVQSAILNTSGPSPQTVQFSCWM